MITAILIFLVLGWAVWDTYLKKGSKGKHAIHTNGNVRITQENGNTRIDISDSSDSSCDSCGACNFC